MLCDPCETVRHCTTNSTRRPCNAMCSTPMTCSGAAALVDESIDLFRLHRLQDVQPRTVYLAPGVVEGPRAEPDFLMQETCLASVLREYALPLIAIALIFGALGYFGRTLGWL